MDHEKNSLSIPRVKINLFYLDQQNFILCPCQKKSFYTEYLVA